MVVRHDMCFTVIYLCHVFGSFYFAFTFFTSINYEPFVVISYCIHLTYLDAR